MEFGLVIILFGCGICIYYISLHTERIKEGDIIIQ